MQVDLLIATEVNSKSGKIIGGNCFGTEKVLRFKTIAPNSKILEFYSDSYSDTPLAQYAKQAFFVHKGKIILWGNHKKSIDQKLCEQFLTKKFFAFLVCGGLGTLSNLILSVIASCYFNPITAYAIGYSASLCVTYILNSYLVFIEKLSIKKFIRFTISYIPNFLILFTFVVVFINIIKMPKLLVYSLASCLGLPVTYIIIKYKTFTK